MSDFAKKFNLKSPAVKRLMREAAELSEPTEQYVTQPLEDNLFEWHFTVRGPPDSEFAGGRYHGRITLPPEYPMKPPSIILLTPNGRFELGKKICLSMSAHHPETWQPSWSIRTVLLALIGFMPTKGGGAIGALDYTSDERKLLAERSLNWKCEGCGIDHQTCLLEVDPEHENTELKEARELAAQIDFKGESAKSKTSQSQAQQPKQAMQPNQAPFQPQNFPQNIQQAYMAQYHSMFNQPGVLSSGQSTPSPQQTVSSNTMEVPSNTTNTTDCKTPENTNTENLRQRTNINSQAPTTEVQNDDPPASTPAQRMNTHGHSRIDSITVILMWIITAFLVLLILRRLVLEGTNMAKS